MIGKSQFVMPANLNDWNVTLPEELRQQFVQVERRLWRVETAAVCCAAAGGLIFSWLVLFVSDRFWDSPVWLRLGLAGAGAAAAVAAGVFWARRWVWRRRNLESLARLVQKRYRLLGDRLLGIVELAQEKEHGGNFSPALYHAAIRQVADEARGYDFAKSVSATPARRWALGTAAAAVCLVLTFLLLPRAAVNSLARWFLPAASIPRYTLVELSGVPAHLIVAHGEPFHVTANVRYRSFWKPRHGWAWWPRQPRIDSTVAAGKIELTIPGQTEQGVLKVKVGDAQALVNVEPEFRPALQNLSAEVVLPAYLRYPKQTQPVQAGSLTAVAGSGLTFTGTATRQLAQASVQNGDGTAAPLKIHGEKFTTGEYRPDGASEYIFNWTDSLGLSNAVPLRLAVQMQPDAAPTPEIMELPREVAMLASDVLRVRVRASDDYGVSDYGLMWDLTEDSPHGDVASTEIKTQASAPNLTAAEHTFLWSPSLFRIPQDSTVELEGYARDYYPDRDRALTGVYRIRVLSPEEHAEAVREQLENVMGQIEEVTRLQEKVVTTLADVKDGQKMPDAQKSARVGQSKDDQNANADQLKQLSQQGEQALREAMKNPLFKAETIEQWSSSVRQWRDLAQDKMRSAADAMQSAQQHPQSSSPEMADALHKAEDILKQLEKMENQANQHMDELQAMTLSQRLRKVGGEEKQIGGQLVDAAQNTIGLLPNELPEKLKLFEHGLTLNQSTAQTESVSLESEISRFFERTQKEAYGAVSRQMKEARVGDELDRVGGLIANNIGMEASANLNQWSEHFQKWSDELEPKSKDEGSNSSSNSKSNQSKQDMTKQLIALLRLRESELNLHDQTSVLDQAKGEADYPKRAASLGADQDAMAANLNAIHKDTPVESLNPAFSDAGQAMGRVSSLLRQPQTGKPADDAEIKSVDTLTDLINLINEQAQRPKPSQSQSQSQPGNKTSQEEMEFLLQMMRNSGQARTMSTQPSTGLNHAGGSTSRQAGGLHGNAAGKGAGTRDVEKAAGIIRNSPAEFRDALENYYHGIEQAR